MCFIWISGKNNVKGGIKMAKFNSSDLENLKWSTANQTGINLKQGYNGDISAKDAGRIGGQMVKKMIDFAENNMPEAKGTAPGTRF
jgi:hypothetical protein